MAQQQKLAHANAQSMAAHYPAGVKWDAFDPNLYVSAKATDLLKQGVESNPNGTAINFMGKKMTFSELDEQVKKAAKGLQESGIGKGNKVGLFMPNNPYYPIMFMAALSIGASVVNFSPLYNEDELAAQIEDSDTDVMVTLNLKDFYGKCESLKEQGKLDNIVKCNLDDALPPMKRALFRLAKGKEIAKPKSPDNHIEFSDLTNNKGNFAPADIKPDDIAVLQYTNGSTGTPKGVMLTHYNLVANSNQISALFARYDETPADAVCIEPSKEKVLAAIPYFHVYGMMTAMLNPIASGNEIVMLPNPRDLPGVLGAIDKEKITVSPLVPKLIQALDEHPKNAKDYLKSRKAKWYQNTFADKSIKGLALGVVKETTKCLTDVFTAVTKYPLLRDFSLTSIKGVVSGGAALATGTLKSFEKSVGRENIIIQGYGMSEASPLVATNPGHGKNKPQSVGIACPETEIKIADLTDPSKTKNIGEAGEIMVRGPQVMKGYYGRPGATAEVLDNDGWLATGDIGHLDEDMYLHITDRKKRIVIVNGENISPSKIEDCLSQHNSVAECVAIGLPDIRSGEALKVMIRYKEGSEALCDNDLRTYLGDKLNRSEMPKYFETCLEPFPDKNGKTDWKAIQDAERAKISAPVVEAAPAPIPA